MSWSSKQGPTLLSSRGWQVDKTKRLCLTGARLIDPQQNLDQTADILIERGKIQKIGEIVRQQLDDVNRLNLHGKIIVPGFFDMHVHLREPGREDSETILTGTTAAAVGGFTGVACMPNTQPAIDNVGIVRWIFDMARGGPVAVHPVAAVTKNRQGNELTDISDLFQAGVRALSNDGDSIHSSETMRRALEYSSMHDMVICTHSEDQNLAGKGVMREGEMSTRLGLTPWCGLAESIVVARDILLAGFTGSRLHIGHISSWQSIEMVRWGKAHGVKVTCEATPHHIALTDEKCAAFDSNFKMNPPLGTAEDRQAVIEGLLDGTIDVIATDHAPHTEEEKKVEFSLAPNGVIGLETALGVVAKELIVTKKLTWSDLVQKMSIAPRKILHLPVPAIKTGEVAELTLIDPEAVWRVDPEKFLSKGRNSAFIGQNLSAKSIGILNRGWVLISPEARILWT